MGQAIAHIVAAEGDEMAVYSRAAAKRLPSGGLTLDFRIGRLAQLGERLPYKQEVGGSIPSPPIA